MNNNSNAEAVMPFSSKENSKKNFRLTDSDMPAAPEKITDTVGYTRMIITYRIPYFMGFDFVREIISETTSVTGNHAEGKIRVHWMDVDDIMDLSHIEFDGFFIYDGEISDSLPNGYGCMKFIKGKFGIEPIESTKLMNIPKGWSYQGEFCQGIPHGKGKMIGPDGFLMEGKFENGMLIEGSFVNKKAGILCREGTFYHGKLKGNSCHLIKVLDKEVTEEYRGGMDYEGFYDGKGRKEIHAKRLFWMDGMWEHGIFIRGVVKYSDDVYYVGECSYSREKWHVKDGWGALYRPDGRIQVGRWEKDKFVEGYDNQSSIETDDNAENE